MRNFLAAVLSVIAVGVILIAYGLLSPRVAAADMYPPARRRQSARGRYRGSRRASRWRRARTMGPGTRMTAIRRLA
jgi:hypothetical protein